MAGKVLGRGGAVAGETDLDPGAFARAGDDVAGGVGRQAALHDGVPAAGRAARIGQAGDLPHP
nr:hypothetical protein [Streptomyces incarnatus]